MTVGPSRTQRGTADMWVIRFVAELEQSKSMSTFCLTVVK